MDELYLINSIALWVIVVFNLLITLALVRKLNTGSNPIQLEHKNSLSPGQLAPDFIAETLQGETVRLATYIGKPVAFLFISTTCGPCREALPEYEALRSKAINAQVELVLVSTSNAAQTRQLADEFKISLPMLIAPSEDNPFMRDYQVFSTPSYCMINERGEVQSAGYPSTEWGAWKALIEVWGSPVTQLQPQ